MDMYCPLTTKKIKPVPKKMWLTDDLRRRCQLKRFFYEEMVKNRLDKDTYRDFAKKLQADIVEAKHDFNSELIFSASNKTKAVWDIIKSKTASSCQTNLNIDVMRQGNESDQDVLNRFNTFLIDACKHNNGSKDSQFLEQLQNNTFFLFPTDAVEVFHNINSLNNTKSTGSDEIPVLLLKFLSPVIAEPLSIMINNIYATGIYPKKLKDTLITPIHKKGDNKVFNNYRPIALSSNISKVIEKNLVNRIRNYITKYQLMTKMQSGFTKGKSTKNTIYQVLQKILASLNDGECVAGLFIDLSKAFDSLNHETLVEKLYNLGIRGVPLELIQSFMDGRRQRITAKCRKSGQTIVSNWEDIKRGVPQGSILGPLLFLLYINELPRISGHCTALFADDTSVVVTASTVDDLQMKVVDCLRTLGNWFSANFLRMNVDKTKIIFFNLREQHELTINLDDKIVTSVSSNVFLGLTIDSQLRWQNHIDFVASKAASFAYSLFVISREVSVEASLCAYYAFIDSRIRYGLIFWGNSPGAKRIFILQKKCVRNMFQLKFNESCKQLFVSKKILTLPSLYIYEVVKFITNNYTYFAHYETCHKYNTRGTENKFLLPSYTNKSTIQSSVQIHPIKIWNKLPSEWRLAHPKDLLHDLKCHLETTAYYSVNDYLSNDIVL